MTLNTSLVQWSDFQASPPYLETDPIDVLYLVDVGNATIQVFESAGSKIINPAVDPKGLAAHPGSLHDGGVAYIKHLLHDIELHKTVITVRLIGNVFQFIFEASVNIADIRSQLSTRPS